MQARADVVVAGGGLIGLACALRLRQAGAEVLLVDPEASPPPASFGNAGHLATEQVEPLASPRTLASAPRRLFGFGGPLDFRLTDIGDWGPWALSHVRASDAATFERGRRALGALMAGALPAWRRLAEALGDPGLVREDGHVVVWERWKSMAAGLAAWHGADIGEAKFAALKPDALAAVQERLAQLLAGGARFTGTGQIDDPARLLSRLGGAFAAAGGQRIQARAQGLSVSDGRAVLSLSDGQRLEPGLILVAAGVGSRALMRQAGHSAPLIAERGYHIEAAAPGWGEPPPVVFEDRSVIATRFGQRLRLAGFVEFGRAEAPPDARKWARLERHARELGLPFEGPISRWMGARPTLPDYLPAIGRSARATNLAYAFGHQHLGLTLAATTGEIVAAMAQDAAPPVDLAPFDIDRFARAGYSNSQRKETST
ncbi:NAD(P)/FAD-dependent oxidoreductase [Phenylobacterium montanum]|uniref:FAD-binding oxidoreductase n=1 Tax=Phenylobacterium montanum TaxID=2823693 RepID=A0A975FYI4_9CAUL|nr:FAD-binding oxidoreductase [Caulobacter sp. S6]QUD87770.1 FAD-binding oxidoreductase [Caulobacter sp. S6]